MKLTLIYSYIEFVLPHILIGLFVIMAPNYSKVLNKNSALIGAGSLAALLLISTQKWRKNSKLQRLV